MFSEKEIITKAWLCKEITELVLLSKNITVDKIFLIGSYASKKQNEWSDLDFLIQLRGVKVGKIYPSWDEILEIHAKLNTKRIHVIFGTEEAAKSLWEKHKHEEKNYAFREITLKEIQYAGTRSPSA